jgi:hypothetical protein
MTTAIFGSTSYLGANNSPIISMDYTSTYVGIGILSPQYQLDVAGNSYLRSNVVVNGSTSLCNVLNVFGSLYASNTAYLYSNVTIGGPLVTNGAATFSNGITLDAGNVSTALNIQNNSNGAFNIALAMSNGQYSSSANQNDVVIRNANTSNKLYLQTGTGAAALTVNSNNFVGIGTTAPGSMLAVSGGATIGSSYSNSAAPSDGLMVQGLTSLCNNLNVYGSATVSNNTILQSNLVVAGATTHSNIVALQSNLTFDNYGSVTVYSSNSYLGVGTTTPAAKLDVYGAIATSNLIRITAGGIHIAPSDTVSAPAYTWSNDTSTGIYNPGAGKVGITCTGSNLLTLANVSSPNSNFLPATFNGSNILVSDNNTYTATASSIGVGQQPWNAFETNRSGYFSNYLYSGGNYTGSVSTVVSETTYNGEWLQLQLPAPQALAQYTLRPNDNPTFTTNMASSWVVAGSTDGTTWTLIDTQSNITWPNSAAKTYTVTGSAAYTYYRLIGLKTHSGAANIPFVVGTWNLIGTPSVTGGNINANAGVVIGYSNAVASTNGLLVQGATSLSNTLNVSGQAAVSNALTVTSNLWVNGATSLSNNLNVYGTATVCNVTALQSNLVVAGTSTHSNSVYMLSNLYVAGQLSVSNVTYVTSNIYVYSSEIIQSNLSVYNDATLCNNLNVFGITTLSNALQVFGSTSLSNTLNVCGVSTLSNALTVTSNLWVNGATSLSNALDVSGVSTLSNALTVTSNLWVNGAASLSNNLNVYGAATVCNVTALQSNLVVAGTTTLSNNLYALNPTSLSNSLDVSGVSTLSNTLTVTSNLWVNGAASLSNNLNVYGAVTVCNVTALQSNLVVAGTTTLSNNLYALSPTSLSNTLNVSGVTTLSNALTVTSNMWVNGAASLSNTLNVSGVTTLSNALTVTSNLWVNGAASLSNNLNVYGAATVCNVTALQSNLVVAGITTLSNNLYVLNPTSLSNSLNVSGRITFSNALTVTSNVWVNGATSLSNALNVSGVSTFSNAVQITSNIVVVGSTSLSNPVIMSSNLATYGMITHCNTVTLNSNLTFSNMGTITMYTSNNFLGVGRSNPDKLLTLGAISATISNPTFKMYNFSNSTFEIILSDSNTGVLPAAGQGDTVLRSMSNLVITSLQPAFTSNVITAVTNAPTNHVTRAFATDLTQSNASSVSSWGLSNAFSQGTTSQKPIYYSANGYSNSPYVSFVTASNSHLSRTNLTYNINTNGGVTIISMMRFNNNQSFPRIFTAGGPGYIEWSQSGLSMTFNMGGSGGPGNFAISTGNVISIGEWAVFTVRLNGSTNATSIYKNYTSVASGTSAYNSNVTMTTNYIGRSLNADPYLGADISHFLMYDSFVPDATLSNVVSSMLSSGFTSTPYYNSLVIGSNNISISGASVHGGAATFSNQVTMMSNLVVAGTTTFSNSVTMLSNLTINGSFSLGNSFTAGGASTSINSNLIVGGTSTLSNNVYMLSNSYIAGKTSLSNTLDVSGVSTLSNALTVTSNLWVNGAASLSNNLNVYGSATVCNVTALQSNLVVAGTTTLSNSLQVLGPTSLSNTLNVSGVSTLSNALTVTSNLWVNGAASLSNNLNVYGSATVCNVTALQSNLVVAGTTTLSNSLQVLGPTSLSNTLDVSGVSTLSNALNVYGLTTLQSNLTVAGTATFSNNVIINSNVMIAGQLTVSNVTYITSNIHVYSSEIIQSNLTVYNVATLCNALNVFGAIGLSNTLSVSGAASFSNPVTMLSNLNVYGTSTLSNVVTLNSNLTFSNYGTITAYTSNSFLGLGTSNPVSTLHVQATGSGVTIDGGSSSTNLTFQNSNSGTVQMGLCGVAGQFNSNATGNDFVLQNVNPTGKIFVTNGSNTPALLVNSNNFVGINNPAPLYNLDILGTMSTSGTSFFGNVATFSNNLLLAKNGVVTFNTSNNKLGINLNGSNPRADLDISYGTILAKNFQRITRHSDDSNPINITINWDIPYSNLNSYFIVAEVSQSVTGVDRGSNMAGFRQQRVAIGVSNSTIAYTNAAQAFGDPNAYAAFGLTVAASNNKSVTLQSTTYWAPVGTGAGINAHDMDVNVIIFPATSNLGNIYLS